MSKLPSMFASSKETSLPLPLEVAKRWNFPLAYVEQKSGYLYSVHDWIKGLLVVKDARSIWSDIKNRSEFSKMSGPIPQHPYISTDGKTYQMDFIDDKGLYLIAQHLRVTKKRVVLKKIKEYLADAGVFADKARIDPDTAINEIEYYKLIKEGFSPEEAQEWLEVRQKQKLQRVKITAIWRVRGVNKPVDFAYLTNQIHRVALGRTATRHKRELAVKDTPRNYISAADNATIQITEFTSSLLHDHKDSIGKTELSEDIEEVRPIIDSARPEIRRVFSQKPRRIRGTDHKPLHD